ncbi:MAG: YbaB/EbfC family nucleoid-associated protein [Candidatus Kapabacteria bacterium]|nr:YbaB/EbfC family nucleoid-associated protein [Candidatus Kapabacteria bacterium]
MKFDMQNMLSQAKQLQADLEKTKSELAHIVVRADAGAGMVSVEMTCANELLKIKISKDVVEMNDIEMLEDLVVAAVNKAYKQAAERSNEEMSKLTGMLPNIPGMNFNM